MLISIVTESMTFKYQSLIHWRKVYIIHNIWNIDSETSIAESVDLFGDISLNKSIQSR